MKKMYVWVSMLLLGGALLVSCSDDEGGDDNKKITLSEETSKKQDFFADETSNNKGIQFTTQGPWQAKVEDVTGTKAAVEADWVVLSQYSGDAAGSYSLTVTLQPNYTGKNRQAVIRIICGDTEITISISQKGNAENGFKPKMVKEIFYEEILGKEKAQEANSAGDKEKMAYFYDERGRVVRIDCYEDGDANKLELEGKYEFDYDVVGEISIKNTYNLDSDYPETELYVATLDKQGRATELLFKNSSTNSDEYVRFGYNEAGQLAKCEYKDYGEEEIIKFGYTDGLLNKVTTWDKYDGEEVTEIPLAKLYPNKYSATMANLDFNGLDFFGDGEMGILYSMRLFGVGSKYLMEISSLGGMDEPVGSVDGGYSTPGEVIHHEYNSTQYHEIDIMNKFELDADKCVTKITCDEPYDVIKVEYDIVVTNELVDPDRPEMGYRGERKNDKETKLRTEKNQYVYTITYQE